MGKKKKNEKNDPEEQNNSKSRGREPADDTSQEVQEGQPEAEQETGKSLEEQLREMNDKYVRARAELENYRKRMQRDASDIREYAKASTIEEFLTVFDHFQMAMDHVDQTPDFETLKQGMSMILAEFQKTFESLGVERVNAIGEQFNPAEHSAVAQEPSETVPKDQVIRQWKCGYRLGNRLLRPATVVVSSGPPGNEEENDSQPETTAQAASSSENTTTEEDNTTTEKDTENK